MRIARLTPAMDAVEAYPITVDGLKAQMPDRAWPGEPTDATLDGTQYVLVREVVQPALEWGQRAVEGTPTFTGTVWEQTWSVQEITVQEARAQLRTMARANLMSRVEDISPVELAAFRELQVLKLAQDVAAVTAADYPLVQAVAAYRGGTFADAATWLDATFMALWNGQVDDYVGKYFDVLDRIQTATTRSEAYQIYLELESRA